MNIKEGIPSFFWYVVLIIATMSVSISPTLADTTREYLKRSVDHDSLTLCQLQEMVYLISAQIPKLEARNAFLRFHEPLYTNRNIPAYIVKVARGEDSAQLKQYGCQIEGKNTTALGCSLEELLNDFHAYIHAYFMKEASLWQKVVYRAEYIKEEAKEGVLVPMLIGVGSGILFLGFCEGIYWLIHKDETLKEDESLAYASDEERSESTCGTPALEEERVGDDQAVINSQQVEVVVHTCPELQAPSMSVAGPTTQVSFYRVDTPQKSRREKSGIVSAVPLQRSVSMGDQIPVVPAFLNKSSSYPFLAQLPKRNNHISLERAATEELCAQSSWVSVEEGLSPFIVLPNGSASIGTDDNESERVWGEDQLLEQKAEAFFSQKLPTSIFLNESAVDSLNYSMPEGVLSKEVGAPSLYDTSSVCSREEEEEESFAGENVMEHDRSSVGSTLPLEQIRFASSAFETPLSAASLEGHSYSKESCPPSSYFKSQGAPKKALVKPSLCLEEQGEKIGVPGESDLENDNCSVCSHSSSEHIRPVTFTFASPLSATSPLSAAFPRNEFQYDDSDADASPIKEVNEVAIEKEAVIMQQGNQGGEALICMNAWKEIEEKEYLISGKDFKEEKHLEAYSLLEELQNLARRIALHAFTEEERKRAEELKKKYDSCLEQLKVLTASKKVEVLEKRACENEKRYWSDTLFLCRVCEGDSQVLEQLSGITHLIQQDTRTRDNKRKKEEQLLAIKEEARNEEDRQKRKKLEQECKKITNALKRLKSSLDGIQLGIERKKQACYEKCMMQFDSTKSIIDKAYLQFLCEE